MVNMVGSLVACNVCKRRVDWKTTQQCSCNSKFYCLDFCSIRTCEKRDNCREHKRSCWGAHNLNIEEDHIPLDPVARLLVQNITESESDQARQKQLHQEDAAARWFDIDISLDLERGRLRIYDRFNDLCELGVTQTRAASDQYPFLVSFIGKSAVGKSSLIRAMLYLRQLGIGSRSLGRSVTVDDVEHVLSTAHGPVSRSKLDDPVRGTTRGIHLYRGENDSPSETASGQRVLLFADCEGFSGGMTPTNSEKYGAVRRGQSRNRSGSPGMAADDTTESTITEDLLGNDGPPNPRLEWDIEATSYGSNGKSGVELFYARFLYALSSVVVFVTDHDSHLENDLKNLFEWASSAVLKSVNNPSRKTLIIVQHMSSQHHPELYDSTRLEYEFLRKLPNLWEDSSKLREFRDEYNDQQSGQEHYVGTNEELFRLFFDKIVCCYIPHSRDVRGKPQELLDRYIALNDQIETAVGLAQNGQLHEWNNFNVPTFAHIVRRAFEHFRFSNETFDFYTAARVRNTRPHTLVEHLSKFMYHAYQSSSGRDSIDRFLSEAIATALVVRETRSQRPGYAAEIYVKEVKPVVAEAFKTYVAAYQTCAYTFAKQERCTARLTIGHSHHCSPGGKRIRGDFLSPLHQRGRFLQFLEKDFTSRYDAIHGKVNRLSTKAETETMRRDNLIDMRKRLFSSYKTLFKAMKSNLTCLSCADKVPDHVLRCGHAYCLPCIQDFGTPSQLFESDWILEECPLCSEKCVEGVYTIRLKPRCAGVRLLTLDGGGIRGIIEIGLLKAVCDKIGLGASVPIRSFFDLIIGTSTGGVIALALATTDTATDAMAGIFKELAKKTFRNKRIRLDPYTVLGKVLVLIDASESIYSQIPLRESLKNLFGDRNLFSAIQASALTYGTRVAVTSARDDEANRCLIASYNRAELGYSDDFEREDEHDADLKIWQAGLATSAAPFFLPPYRHDLTDKEYVDGALFANCPASVAIEEKDKIWPGSSSLDYLISVGTGIQSRNENLPWLFKRRWGGMDKCLATFFRSLDTESIWTTFKQTFGGGRSTARRLHRLNVKITDRVRLDEYKEMDNLEKLVDAQVAEPIQRDTIARIARVIMAGLFFFEPDEDSRSAAIAVHPVVLPQRSQKAQLSGSIRCRLRLGSEELTTLLKQIDGFDFAEVVHPDEATEIPDHAWMSVPGFHVAEHDISTGTEKRFQLRHNLETELPDGAMLALAVRFNDNNQMIREPISGFPASLRELERRARAEM